MKQQFHRGDLVYTLPEYWDKKSLRHPAAWAIIIASYYEQYGGGEAEKHTYSILWLTKEGYADHYMSWWDDDMIEYLVQPRCLEMLDVLDNYLENSL